MQSESLNPSTNSVVHGQLRPEVIEQVKQLVSNIGDRFTGQYRRRLQSPKKVSTGKVADHAMMSRLMDISFGSKRAALSDMKVLRGVLNPNTRQIFIEKMILSESVLEDIMISLDITRDKLPDTTIWFKGLWLKDGVRLYHPERKGSNPAEPHYLEFDHCTLETEEFFQALWKYYKQVYKCDDRFSVCLRIELSEGKPIVELKKPEYILKMDFV